MSRTITAIALVLASCASVSAAPRATRNPECAPLARIFKATITARQRGTDKKDVVALTAMLEGDIKAKAAQLIEQVYSQPVFESAPAATAGAFFSATCR